MISSNHIRPRKSLNFKLLATTTTIFQESVREKNISRPSTSYTSTTHLPRQQFERPFQCLLTPPPLAYQPISHSTTSEQHNLLADQRNTAHLLENNSLLPRPSLCAPPYVASPQTHPPSPCSKAPSTKAPSNPAGTNAAAVHPAASQ